MLVSDILILTSSFSSNVGVQMYSTLKTLFSNRAQNRRQAGNMALITITFLNLKNFYVDPLEHVQTVILFFLSLPLERSISTCSLCQVDPAGANDWPQTK